MATGDTGVGKVAGWVVPGAAMAAAVGFFLLEVVAITQYDYFRDELYYLASTGHPALGYVDHPPLSILVLTVWTTLFGDSLVALRSNEFIE